MPLSTVTDRATAKEQVTCDDGRIFTAAQELSCFLLHLDESRYLDKIIKWKLKQIRLFGCFFNSDH